MLSASPKYTFRKSERLCSRKAIAALYEHGSTVSVQGLRLVFLYQTLPSADAPMLQVVFAVSKRHFRLAVQRNRIKRLLREAYRHQKHELAEAIAPEKQLQLAIVYTASKEESAAIVSAMLKEALQRLATRMK